MMDHADDGTRAGLLHIRNRQIAAVHTITRRLFSTLGLDDRLRDILTVSLEAVDAVAGSIYLHRKADDKLVFQYVVGPQASGVLTGRVIDAQTGIAGKVYQEGRGEIENHPGQVPTHRRDIDEEIGFVTRNMVTVPIMHSEGSPVGVMQILNKRAGDFGRDDLEVLEIVAAIAATAIENAHLQREAEMAAVAHAVGDLSHDIKNKVSPIAISAYMLRPDIDAMFEALDEVMAATDVATAAGIREACGAFREEYGEHIDIILAQVQAVQEHTKRIADVLKGIVTEPQLDLRDPAPIIEEQVRQIEPIARSRDVRLVADIAALPTCRVDRLFLQTAVYNLMNNAVPETPSGGCVRVRAEAMPFGTFPDGRYLLIEVQDTGRGMPGHVLQRILRGEATSNKPGGTGLGTRIVYNAAAAHRGLFEGESQEGKGTTFRLKLPLVTE
jgi:signal transduction histidine kinase